VLRVRVQSMLTVTLMAANVVGAVVVVLLQALVAPSHTLTGRTYTVLLVTACGYVVVGLLLGGWLGTRRTLRVLAWALEQRRPDDAERAASMRVPLQLTMVQATLWGAAIVVFTVLAALMQPALLPDVPVTTAFTGIVVCAHAYLLSEFALRPVAARALSTAAPDRLLGPGVRPRMLLFWCLGTGVPVAGLITFALLALLRGDVPTPRLAIAVIVLGGIVLVVGLMVTVFTTRAIVAPIQSVRTALSRVRSGDLTVDIPVYDGTELGLLQAGVNLMARGLRDRERIRDLFGRHVGEDVAAAALTGAIELGGEVREVSVLFVDLVGSTALAAARPPTEVVALLNKFFAIVVDEITVHGGLVNKFVGDAVLAVFGAPVPLADHATRALAAARAIAVRLHREAPEMAAGTGVATGQVVAGNVGDRRRFEYTVIGDPVNEAARLTDHAKTLPDRLVASWTAIDRATPAEAERWRPAGSVTLRGRNQETVLAVLRDHITDHS
jgi:adenylate cyclase